jgi:hypothetical protein
MKCEAMPLSSGQLLGSFSEPSPILVWPVFGGGSDGAFPECSHLAAFLIVPAGRQRPVIFAKNFVFPIRYNPSGRAVMV